ncbi:MAG: hypothetical protein KBS75_07390 [Bacteroidales bacterium]|nr:hypothetical protein [Candidatus Equimonas faecalis]
MKRLLMLIVALAAVIATGAQSRRAATLDGTVEWGFATGQTSEWKYVNVRFAGQFGVAMKIPYEKALKGATVNAISIPFMSDNIADLKIFAGATMNDEGDAFFPTDSLLAIASYSGAVQPNGYTTVCFDKPVPIPSEGLFVGYLFNVTRLKTDADAHAVIDIDLPSAEHSLWLMSGSSWSNMSWQAAPTAMLAHVAGASQPAVSVALKSAAASTVSAGATAVVNASVVSNGGQPITSVEYTVEIDGKQQSYTQTLDEPVPAGFKRRATLPLSFVAPASVGSYTATLTLTKFNGQASDKAVAPRAFSGTTLGRIVQRRSVVEESTGTGCIYCPRGWVAMEYLKKNEPAFIGVSVHNYNADDPMACLDYPDIFKGSPTCVIDRKNESCDAYYGTYGPNGIRTDFATINAEPADVDLALTASLGADGKTVEAVAGVEYLGHVENPTIAFVLTADSLRGTTSAWRQKNTWGSQSKESILLSEVFGGMTELAEFGIGGMYGSSSVFITYNDVCVAHSFASGTGISKAHIEGGKVGDRVESRYTLALPTRPALLQAIRPDKLFAVAFVMDGAGRVCNAARVRVSLPEGIGTVVRPAATAAATGYDLTGRTLSPSAAAHGLRIVGGKKVLGEN